MKQTRYLNYGFLVLPIIALIIALASLPFLPDLIPLHWNGAGIVERTGSKLLILLFPAISFFIVVSGYLKPKIDPKGDNYNKMPREYRLIHFLILIFILGFEIYLIAYTLGVPIGVNIFTSILLGALVTALGNYLPKIPQNFLIGVKTIWGYSNEGIWLKTQRMAGRLWFVLGLLLMATAFLSGTVSGIFRIAILVTLVLVPRLYSFTLFYLANKK